MAPFEFGKSRVPYAVDVGRGGLQAFGNVRVCTVFVIV